MSMRTLEMLTQQMLNSGNVFLQRGPCLTYIRCMSILPTAADLRLVISTIAEEQSFNYLIKSLNGGHLSIVLMIKCMRSSATNGVDDISAKLDLSSAAVRTHPRAIRQS